MTAMRSDEGIVPEWDLADRLSKSLREAGIGVAQMAGFLGVTRETIGRWINGRGVPRRHALLAWAAVTGVSLEWLETGEARATVDAGLLELPRLDSNQQPSGYLSALVRGLEGQVAVSQADLVLVA